MFNGDVTFFVLRFHVRIFLDERTFANLRFALRLASLACSQTFALLSDSLRSLVRKPSLCSPTRFARLFANLRFALRLASLACSQTFALLSDSLRSLVRKPSLCSPTRFARLFASLWFGRKSKICSAKITGCAVDPPQLRASLTAHLAITRNARKTHENTPQK